MRLEEVVNCLSDKTEIAVCYHLEGVFPYCANEFLHLLEDSIMLEVFKTKNIFVTCFSADEEEDVVNSTDGAPIAITDIIVEDIAYVLWAWDGR